MTILFVISRFEIGGVVSFLEVLTNFLVNKGIDVVIMGGEDLKKNFPFKDYFKSPRVKVYTHSLWQKKRWLEELSCLWGSFLTFSKLIKKHKIDLLALNHPAPALGIMLHSGSRKIPKVFHFHGAWDIEEDNSFVLSSKNKSSFWLKKTKLLKHKVRLINYHLIEQFCLLNSDRIVALSQKSKKLLLNHFKYLNKKEINILPSGVDQHFFEPGRNKSLLRKKMLLNKNIPILFTLCRFDKKKGLENLLKAAAILKREGYSFKLIIAGPVSSGWFYNRDIFNLYEELNLHTNVHFLHCLNKKEKLAFFQASDLFVFPSVAFEAYPYVIMEAMACGLPVVATAVGGVPDMLGNLGNSLLTKGKAPKYLAERITWFLNLNNQEKNKLRQKCVVFTRNNLNGEERSREIYSFYRKMLKLKS